MKAADGREPLAVLDRVSFSYDQGRTWALDEVSLTIRRGQQTCIIGANGSGKSTLARLLSGSLAPDRGRIELMGRVVFDSARPPGQRVDTEAYRQAREHIGMVFQSPEDQIVTTVTEDDVAFGPENRGMSRPCMQAAVSQALRYVNLAGRRRSDPTRMSGGQQQRVAIAGALAMHPDMMVMDEPGAMLDSAGRRKIATIMADMAAHGKAVVNITHLLDEARAADRVIVLDRGRIVTVGSPEESLSRLQEELHGDMFDADMPVSHGDAPRSGTPDTWTDASDSGRTGSPGGEEAAVTAKNLSFSFDKKHRNVVDHLDLSLEEGKTLAVLGPNGSGKSTLARLICALVSPKEGDLSVAGITLAGEGAATSRRVAKERLRMLRHRVGYVMQKPEHQLFAETVAQDVAYGPRNLGFDKEDVTRRVNRALSMLGLGDLSDRSPFDLSGGQQRLVAIAGVLASSPRILVLDEVTASLDARAAQTIVTMLEGLHQQGVTVILITHDEEEVCRLADQAILMDRGHLVSRGGVDEVLRDYRGLQTQGAPMESEETTVPADSALSATGGENQVGRPSLVERLDPRAKMVCFLMLMVTSFCIGTGPQLILGALTTVAIILAARISPLKLLKSVSGLLALMAVVALLNLLVTREGTILARWGPLIVTDQGLRTALVYSCRFGLVLLLGALLLMTTTPTRMTDAFESLLSPLSRLGIHTSEISLVLSLALRFIPTLVGEMQAIREAQAARGGSVESGNLSSRTRAMVSIVVPVFAAALRHADNLGQALDARAYRGGQDRTHYRESHLKGIDYGFMGLVVIYFVLLVVLIVI